MNQRITVTASIVLAMLIASIDTTILHTTMPIITEDLGGFSLYAWTFTAYILASTSLMPLAGKLADLFGRKRLFIAGVLIFLLGSILCGVAGSMLELVIFRAIQGLGAGIMTPLVQIIAGDLFPVRQRGKIQALFTSMWMLSAILAPVLGAAFIEWMDWRWIFYINVPICLLCLLTILPYKDTYEAKPMKIDGWGALMFALGSCFLLLVTAVESFRLIWGLAGAALLLAFIRHEKKHPAPMIPARLFKKNALAWIYFNNFVICLAMFGVPNYIPLFLQEEGYSVLFSGLALLPMSVGWMSLSVGSGKWILLYGYRRLLLIGNSLLVLAAAILLTAVLLNSLWLMIVALIVLGGAFGLTFTVSIIGAQQWVEKQDKGISTSLQMFVRNTGLAIGVSLMGLILNQSEAISSGMPLLFLYGTVGSIISFFVALKIRDRSSSASTPDH